MSQATIDTPLPSPPRMSRTRDYTLGGVLWPALCLLALLVFNFFATPGFFHIKLTNGHLFGSLIDILYHSAPLMLIALGMTLVIATGGVDLSVGAIVAIAGSIVAGLISRSPDSALSGINVHGSVTLTILAALFAGLLCGLWNGLLVAVVDIQPIIATLILMVAGRGVAQLLNGGQVINFHNPRLEFFGTGFMAGVPFPVYIAVFAAIVTGWFARGTALGLFVESVGNNPTASYYAGVNARLVKLTVYAFCGVCSAMAGVITAADVKGADFSNAGLYKELDAILAASIGGTALVGGRFSLVGSILGAVMIQTLQTTILARGVPQSMTLVVKALVVIAVCLLQSEAFRAQLLGFTRRKSK